MENVHEPDNSEFRKLYPTLTESELKEAEANFRRYIALVIDVRRTCDAGTFDNSGGPNMLKERSNADLKN